MDRDEAGPGAPPRAAPSAARSAAAPLPFAAPRTRGCACRDQDWRRAQLAAAQGWLNQVARTMTALVADFDADHRQLAAAERARLGAEDFDQDRPVLARLQVASGRTWRSR